MMMITKDQIVQLLERTNREGMDNMLVYLEESGFYESPASTKYHGCYEGGLAQHSLNVYKLLCTFNEEFGLEAAHETLIIAALLHDVCKIGAYLGDSKPYSWNREQPKGHAQLSLIRIKGRIPLTDIEEMMIRFHMGVYGLEEFDDRKGEYPLRGDQSLSKEERRGKSMANAWFHNPIVKVMYFCDEMETLSAKAAEAAE